MKTFVSRLNINDFSNFDFFEARVDFYDDVTVPHPGAAVTVYLKKDTTKTIDNIKIEAVQKAIEYLKSVLTEQSS